MVLPMRVWPVLLLLAACDRKDPHADMKPAESWDQGSAVAGDPGGPALPKDPSGSPHGDQLPPNHPPIDDDQGGGDMPPPRDVDPSQFLRGSVTLAAGAKVPDTGILFLAVRTPGPDGKPVDGSMPLAVDMVENPTFPHAFELTAHQQIGATFSGDVLVVARIDQDGDADTKQPGDLYGVIKATIPADKLALTLEPL